MGDFADAWRRTTTDLRRALESGTASGGMREDASREAAPNGELSEEAIDRLLAPELDLASTLTKFRYR